MGVRTRSNVLKLQQRWEMRRKFLTMRAVKHWNRLPGDVMEISILGNLQEQDGRTLVWADLVQEAPTLSRGWTRCDPALLY